MRGVGAVDCLIGIKVMCAYEFVQVSVEVVWAEY